MTAKELAERFDGIEYPLDIPAEVFAAARMAGLVIVFGLSDDLMEFRGAIVDEIGAYNGAKALVDAKGLIPDFEQIDRDGRHAKEVLRDYFAREGGGRAIEALWCAEPGYSWTFRTDIPHETFKIVEDGEPYCQGIVFSLSDLAANAEPAP